MEKYKSLQDFLQQKGVSSQTPMPDIVALKKAYWKEKRKLYYQIEKQRERRINITLSNQEYALVKRSADLHGERVTPHAKAQLLAQLNKSVLLPNEDAIFDLIAEINAIGNNINQVVHTMHAVRAYHDMNRYNELLVGVRQYQKRIETYLKNPPDLYEALEKDLMQNPHHEHKLQQLLHQIQTNKSKDDNQE